MEILSPKIGIVMLLIFAGMMWVIAKLTREEFTKENFLVAGRNLNPTQASFSIAASWVWAPALLVSAQQAYQFGFVGLFWFTIPNILSLILFGFVAKRIIDRVPNGYTLTSFMRNKYSPRVQGLYLIQVVLLTIASFAVQLIAGGRIISLLTGLNYNGVVIAMSVIALSYSLVSGIKASVLTDYFQMILIVVTVGIVAPLILINADFETIKAGFSGVTGQHSNLFSTQGLKVALAFGLPTTVGLLAGPLGDQAYWQRAFSIPKEYLKSSFIKGGLIFGLIPIAMGLIGFFAAGTGMTIQDPSLVNLEVAAHYLSLPVLILFTYALICGLVSTLDSCYCSISSLAGHDLLNIINSHNNIKCPNFVTKDITKLSMVFLGLLGITIALIPNMEIIYLFLLYGTLRAVTLLPTVLTVITDKITERAMFISILIAMVIGVPIFGYGEFVGNTKLAIFGIFIILLNTSLGLVIMSDLEGGIE